MSHRAISGEITTHGKTGRMAVSEARLGKLGMHAKTRARKIPRAGGNMYRNICINFTPPSVMQLKKRI